MMRICDGVGAIQMTAQIWTLSPTNLQTLTIEVLKMLRLPKHSLMKKALLCLL